MAKRQRKFTDLLALISLLFFTSGSTGLAYEVIWSKRFTHIWGSSSLAMASVVASFLFGLGLGALLLGRVADRIQRPLFWYGVAEIAIGLLAAVIPFEIVALSDLAIRIHPLLPEVESIRFLVRCGLTLLVIGPPCVLMGGTLPLLIRQFTPRDGELGAVVGWLYAINTFGAAAGCAMAGFYLLPALGLMITNYATAAVNLIIGGVSIAISLGMSHRLEEALAPLAASTAGGAKTAPRPREAAASASSAWGVYLAVALTGLAALILQMVWVRQLSLVLGGSTYAFTATLFVVLVAIALGSLIYQVALQRFAGSVFLPLGVIGALALSTILGTLLLPWLSEFASDYRDVRANWYRNAELCIIAASIVQLLPGIAMGILFPLLVDLTHAAAAVVGRTVGNVYAWNTLGSIVGATFTSFYLIPWLGTVGTIAFAIALYAVACGLLMLPIGFSAKQAPIWGAYAIAAGAMIAGMAYHQSRAFDNALDTNFGLYMYDVSTRNKNIDVSYFVEGASSNVLVIEYKGANARRAPRSLRVNGKVDASTELDMPTQLGLAYFPRFFNARAKEVLVIGFGSGTTSGASLLFPDTHVTCCEIEPAVYGASEQFAHVNHSPERKSRAWLEAHNKTLPPDQQLTPEQIDQQAKFDIVFGDGRTVLQTSQTKFDLIISEPSNPWLAGVSNLFTREFFEAAKEHLNEGGVLAQWIQTYNFTVAEYSLIVRTMRQVFPYAGVVCLTRGADTILLASTKPLIPSADDLAFLDSAVKANPELLNDLQTRFPSTDVRRLLLMHYYLDQEGLERFVARDTSASGLAGEINTDLNMKLEFDAPLQLFSSKAVDVFPTIRAAADPDWTSKLAQALGHSPSTAVFFADLGAVAADREQFDLAVEQFRRATQLDPNYLPAYQELAAIYERLKRRPLAIEALTELVRRVPNQPALRIKLAGLLTEEKRPGLAIEQYREVLRLNPGEVVAMNNLAWLLATCRDQSLRDGELALKLAKQACDGTQNSFPGFLDTLAAAYAELGRYDEAIRTLQTAIEAANKRNETSFVAASRGRMELYQQGRPYREG
ncbi:MAG: fused MFS/spermidine synthase [Planctomycetaceae bacterium]|nr:fused MFS/spermidine synthase [Planctomycetaceae bacterium]